MQEAVGGVGRGAAGVVAHADGEDGVLARGDGHAGAGGHLQHDQAESGRHGVGEPGEGGRLPVAAEQFGVFGVAGGQQLGLEAEGDEPGGVGRVGRGDGRGGRRVHRLVGGARALRRVRGGRLAPRVGVLCAVVAHDGRSLLRKGFGTGWAAPARRVSVPGARCGPGPWRGCPRGGAGSWAPRGS